MARSRSLQSPSPGNALKKTLPTAPKGDFYLVRTLVHISHGSYTECHTHTDLPPSQSSLGLTHSPCFPSPALGLWHQELLCSTCSSQHIVGKVATLCGWPFWQGTLSICHVTAEPLPQMYHHTCPIMTPWLASYILKITFVVDTM